MFIDISRPALKQHTVYCQTDSRRVALRVALRVARHRSRRSSGKTQWHLARDSASGESCGVITGLTSPLNIRYAVGACLITDVLHAVCV